MPSADTPRTWTILDLINWSTEYFAKRGIDSPRLDTEVLLAHVLGLQRVHLYTRFDRPVGADELARFKALLVRRARDREPVAYLVGSREFWSLSLEVGPAVLIPRPDTERLVEVALLQARRLQAQASAPLRIVDVGTGTGAIAIALASELPEARLCAIDLSAAALDVARRNVEAHGLAARIALSEGDLLAPLSADWRPVHLVVSNPPYVTTGEAATLQAEVRHEPALALLAGDDGFSVIDRLVPQAYGVLAAGGALVCEIGSAQGAGAAARFERAGFQSVEVLRDYANLDRVVCGTKPG